MPKLSCQFWIDVGGTFTDCLARLPDGTLRRHKLLSSGVTKGTVAQGSTASSILDPRRQGEPARFWVGYEFSLLDSAGRVVQRTDVTAFDADNGHLTLATPLANAPSEGEVYELRSDEAAPIVAIRYLLGLDRGTPIPPVSVRLGTTRGTNALITRRGAQTALATTRGFADVLRIGNQNRPKLFELTIRKPEALFSAVVEIDERVSAQGEVLLAPNPAQIRRELQRLRGAGLESLAICLLHAYRAPEHERLVAEIAGEVGFREISVSSDVAPLMRIVARGDTTVVDAYLNPVLRRYVADLRAALPGSDLQLLTSAGGLVPAERFCGKDSILSGPAGGVVGYAQVAQAASFARAIGFDMGGTSTDVSRFDGRYRLEYETEKSGVRIVAPMLAIETVAAGGGSICRFDGVKLVVGPESCAEPGPACYGRGGPLAVTDSNFYLGRLPGSRFPLPLQRAPVERLLNQICDEIESAIGKRYTLHELADGFLQVANVNMAAAISSISIAEGVDQREYVLVAFGGAAPQHACSIARQLAMRQVLIHPDAGLLSAYGIGLADVTRHRVAGIYRPFDAAGVASSQDAARELDQAAREELVAEGVAVERIASSVSLDLRYRGVDHFLSIAVPHDAADWTGVAAAFAVAHEQLYGYRHAGRPLEIVAVRVEVVGRSEQRLPPAKRAKSRRIRSSAEAHAHSPAFFAGQLVETPIFERADLSPDDVLSGPAIVADATSTTVIEPGWQAEVLSGGELLLTDISTTASRPAIDPQAPADPILLEIFNNRFSAIAEQMGITLRNTASSVNVKERLDFSCALFTAGGDLVVNAPHIPVHLGAMGESVRQVIAQNPTLWPGDVFVTNDPFRGGSHLPDVTVVTPVHDAAGENLLFFTASRAHHAEIGGIRPGSVPPDSRTLADEGVLISNFKLVDAGTSREEALRELLLAGPYPTRNVADNLADVAAQVAANRQGARELAALIDEYTLPVVLAYMRHIQSAAALKMRRAIARLADGRRAFVDHLDDGSLICAAITVDGERMSIDFTGTGPVLPGNLNANRAIVTAAVMYCMRLLIDEEIPLNQGVLEPIELILPECLLNPRPGATPATSPAVVGGNTETSQRVVDVLLGALGLSAASQGTMNNLTFGNARFGYYETICGGAGATADADGADAVHTHMTNTRLTDPEVLELRYPVRVHEFSIRQGSGGAGEHRGGNGVVRKLEFLDALEVSLLTSRRGPYAPYGQQGGSPGALGENILTRANGSVEQLPGQAQFQVTAGDSLTLLTPGGGGWG